MNTMPERLGFLKMLAKKDLSVSLFICREELKKKVVASKTSRERKEVY